MKTQSDFTVNSNLEKAKRIFDTIQLLMVGVLFVFVIIKGINSSYGSISNNDTVSIHQHQLDIIYPGDYTSVLSNKH